MNAVLRRKMSIGMACTAVHAQDHAGMLQGAIGIDQQSAHTANS